VEKLVFLGSTCIYPKFAEQPIHEEALLTGALEPTNEWYAIAKIAGLELVQAYRRQHGLDFISVMPTERQLRSSEQPRLAGLAAQGRRR
jgi:GDP-L-fucose synthase